MKKITYILSLTAVVVAWWQCQSNKQQTAIASTDIVAIARQTHKEAADTLRADTNAALVPVILKLVEHNAAKALLDTMNLAPMFANTWPDNGFYGADHYRIEFIITSMERTINDPFVYAVKGKNKFKKTISEFEGSIEIKDMMEFKDTNLDTAEINSMSILKTYSLAGEFNFGEDTTKATSGRFKGTFKTDFATTKDRGLELWFYSDSTPAKGAGYRFDGNWTSYKNVSQTKPVIWSRDLFRFANDILEHFSYGDREIEINPKYRQYGWDNFWEGEEWWNETPNQ
jgi:hypothetical protein